MPATFEQNNADLIAFARTAWVNAGQDANLLAYENLQFDPPEDPPKPWARITVQHDGGQRALTRLFRRTGRITVQVFVPAGESRLELDQILDTVVPAFEDAGRVGESWFREVKLREVGSDGVYYQANVIAEFTFDRITN